MVNVFKNPARYAKVKCPFLKYMSNNGSFNQTPDPLTFFFGGGGGDLVAHTFVFWGAEPQDDWQQFTVQEKSFKALLPRKYPVHNNPSSYTG